ncbi:hypothetical protein GIB67_022172, partial [Kingdonia uniflora]
DSPTLSCLASDDYWDDDASIFISTESSGDVPSINEYPDVLGVEGMGIPDFAEVYSFIGSVFDPDSIGHVQKLRRWTPLTLKQVIVSGPMICYLQPNYSKVLLLMRNLTINLSSPDFEPIREVLSSYDMDTENLSDPAGAVDTSQI